MSLLSEITRAQWLLNLHTQDFCLSQALAAYLFPGAEAVSFAAFLDALQPHSAQQLSGLLADPAFVSGKLSLRFRDADQTYDCQLEAMQGQPTTAWVSAQLKVLPTALVTEDKERAALLEPFFLQAPLPMGLLEMSNGDLRHVMHNQQTELLSNKTPAELRAKTLSELGACPASQALWLEACQRAKRMQQPVSFVYAHNLKNQHYWFQVTVAELHAASNHFYYWAQDISEQIYHQEALQAQSELLSGFQLQLQKLNRLSLDNHQSAEKQLYQAICLLAEYVQLERVEVYRPEQGLIAYGAPLASPIDSESYQDWQSQQQVLSYQMEWPETFVPEILETAPVACAIFPFSLSNLVEEVQGLLIVCQPQSDQINEYQLQFITITLAWIEAMLEQQTRVQSLVSLNNNTEQILNILSHDLRNSLSSVIGFSQLLKRRSWVNEEGLDLLERIHQAGKNSHKLLQEMLTVQELEADDHQEHVYRLDLTSLVQQVTETFASQLREQELSFETQISLEVVQLPLHKSWLRRLVDNLISNAIKFTPPGGTIVLSIEQQEQELRVAVRDTGVGIPPDLQEHIFKRFSAARRVGLRGELSTGLGLYLVHQIVELHQGRMGFDSAVNQGSHFWIYLPLHTLPGVL